MSLISSFDKNALELIRSNVNQFIREMGNDYDYDGAKLLDIAPQDHSGAAPFFKKSCIHTLDIDKSNDPTFLMDLCDLNSKLNYNYYDFVVCTEVLEHVLQPFDAVENIYRSLKVGGLVFVSTPFNFRIHGPLPDCWRFTEHGLRELFKRFKLIKLNSLESDRFLAPIQYTLVARKI